MSICLFVCNIHRHDSADAANKIDLSIDRPFFCLVNLDRVLPSAEKAQQERRDRRQMDLLLRVPHGWAIHARIANNHAVSTQCLMTLAACVRVLGHLTLYQYNAATALFCSLFFFLRRHVDL
nr:hypothetical protein [Pandoravirus aubagnensis]